MAGLLASRDHLPRLRLYTEHAHVAATTLCSDAPAILKVVEAAVGQIQQLHPLLVNLDRSQVQDSAVSLSDGEVHSLFARSGMRQAKLYAVAFSLHLHGQCTHLPLHLALQRKGVIKLLLGSEPDF